MARSVSRTKSWIRQEIRDGRGRAARAVGLGWAGVLLAIGQVFCASRLLAAALHPGNEPIGWLAAGFAVAALIRAGLIAAQEREAARLGIAARRRLRSATLDGLMTLGPGLLRGRHSAELAAIVVDRIEAFGGLHGRWIPAAGLALIGPLTVIVAAALDDWRSGLILLVTGLLVPVSMAVTGIGAGVATRRQFIAMRRLQTRFLDRMRGIGTIVLAGRAEAEAEALGAAAAELRRRTMRILRVAFLNATMMDLLAAGALIAVAVRFAAALIAGDLALAPAALFSLLLVPEFFAPLRAFSAVYQDRMTAGTAADELVGLPRAEAQAAPPPPAIRTVPAQGIEIAFEDVCFAWDAARGPVLDRLNFRLPAGETMMLVGPSGSGKSTILELLLGYARPQSGRITVNGAPIESVVPAALARMTALIGQRPFLFAGSIEENIRLGRPEASEAELREAVRLARVAEFTDSLPLGLATPIGEGGYGLSGGQAQRIAIARAFLKDASLLLLDEPTAQLDPATERDVLDSLKRLAIGRTVILASHAAFAHEFTGRKLDLGAAHPARLEGVA
ncbi:MAG TPA: thiol reductant ABC exporter subunit CydD [Acidiphilium sp.]